MNELTGEIIQFRTPYNYDIDQVSTETGLACPEPTLAQQQHRDEVDINTIVTRFGITGQMPTDIRTPMYGDFTGIMDYQSALNAVIAAEQEFNRMPAEIRERFQNDPQQFLEFAENEGNREEMRKMGLLAAHVTASEGTTTGGEPPVRPQPPADQK